MSPPISPFVRFTLTLIIIGVVCSLGLVLIVDYHTSVKVAEADAIGHDKVRIQFEKLDARFRHLDLAIASQKIAGDRKVLETTVVWQEFGYTPDSVEAVPLHPNTATIQSDQLTIEAFNLEFQKNFVLSAELKDHSDLLAGRTFSFFGHLYDTDPKQPQADITPSSGPPPCLVVGIKPSQFERRLWQNIWDLAHSPTAAHDHGMALTSCPPVTISLKLGVIYHIWIEYNPIPLLRVRPKEDPEAVHALLDALEEQSKVLPSDDDL